MTAFASGYPNGGDCSGRARFGDRLAPVFSASSRDTAGAESPADGAETSFDVDLNRALEGSSVADALHPLHLGLEVFFSDCSVGQIKKNSRLRMRNRASSTYLAVSQLSRSRPEQQAKGRGNTGRSRYGWVLVVANPAGVSRSLPDG